MRRRLPLDRLQGVLPPDGTTGLATAEADERRRRYGPNDVLEAPTRGWWMLARDTAADPMLWFLVVTAALYLAVGERAEAFGLLAAVLPLAGMDAFLHHRTAASREGLAGRLASRVTAVRDAVEAVLPAAALVPGDLVLVGPGEPFPADGLVVAGTDLQADESTLTGEAYPVRKRPPARLPADRGEPAVDDVHWGLAGTRLLTGHARLRVVFTGGETLYGEIVRCATSGAGRPTPLQSAIRSLVFGLVAAAVVVCLILAAVRLRQGHGVVDALVSALTLAVAALPEEFPVVFAFFLGVGVYRLARCQALVRRAASVENVGRTSTICADKTGTITEGRLAMTHLVPADDTSPERLSTLVARAARDDSGDPLDEAILRARETSDGAPVLAVFPFTEARRRETAVVREAEALVAATKGAVEVVLAMTDLDQAARAAWSARALALAEEGHKIVAVAERRLDPATWPGGEPDRGYRLAGLVAFEDAVREGVVEAIAACRRAGIHVVMVTGDHAATATAVARQVGLGGARPAAVSGTEMEALVARGEGATLRRVDVIARAVPAQKLALVRALQAAGEIVAVTGDGVNDVPALQAADIGIAMGQRGARSAREIAAIVLLDDNFRTIVDAIREGRQLFRNLRRSFAYLLVVHLPLVVTAALLPLAGYPLLYLPIHIVWLELIIHPTALLVFQDAPAPGLALATAPPPGPLRLLTARDWAVVVAAGGLVGAIVLGGYLRGLADGVEHARALALTALTLSSACTTAVLSRLRTAAARWMTGGTIALTAVLVQVPAFASRLHLAPLHVDDWGAVATGSLLAVAVPFALDALAGRTEARALV
jgi:P-type Ca2+ transporter type 2C